MGAALFGIVVGCAISAAGCSIVDNPVKTVILILVMVIAHVVLKGI